MTTVTLDDLHGAINATLEFVPGGFIFPGPTYTYRADGDGFRFTYKAWNDTGADAQSPNVFVRGEDLSMDADGLLSGTIEDMEFYRNGSAALSLNNLSIAGDAFTDILLARVGGSNLAGTSLAELLGEAVDRVYSTDNAETLYGLRGFYSYVDFFGLGDGDDLFSFSSRPKNPDLVLHGGYGTDTLTIPGSMGRSIIVDLSKSVVEIDGDAFRIFSFEIINGNFYTHTYIGSGNDDHFKLGFSDHTADMKGGDDRVDGRGGNDTVDGGAGYDQYHVQARIEDIDIALVDGTEDQFLVTSESANIGRNTLTNVEEIVATDGIWLLANWQTRPDPTPDGPRLKPGATDISIGFSQVFAHRDQETRVDIGRTLTDRFESGTYAVGFLMSEGPQAPNWIRWDAEALQVVITPPADLPVDRDMTIRMLIESPGGWQGVDSFKLHPRAPDVGRFAGDNILEGTSLDERVYGRWGDDIVTGHAGDDILEGQRGFDMADYAKEAGPLGVTVDLGARTATDTHGDTDILKGIEAVSGTARADTFFGSHHHDDWLYGNGGDDVFHASRGRDLIFGGDGVDHADYADANGRVAINLASGKVKGASGPDRLSSIENATGGAFGDRVLGSAADNVLIGGAGDDLLRGVDGTNFLDGGAGNDIIEGGLGVDTVHAGDGNDTVRAAAGDDVVLGQQGQDRLLGGRGDDTLDGGADNDRLFGNRNSDQIAGGDGDDFLSGGQGKDWLLGQAGDDVLRGDAGADILRGGTGNDRLFGSASGGLLFDGASDRFVFERLENGQDRVKGFEDGIDLLDLTDFGFASFEDVRAIASHAGTLHLKLDFGDGHHVIIEDFRLSDLTPDDVVLT